MSYLVRAYYGVSPTRYYKDDPCWSADLKSKTTKDIINIGSFMEVLVLNHYLSSMENENPIRTLGDYPRPSHEGYRNTIKLPDENIVVPLESDTIQNTKESWALFEDLALYDNEIWNDPSGPHDTQYCMNNPEQAFVDYASSCIEAGGKWFTFKPEQNNLGDTYNSSWKSHLNLSGRPPPHDDKPGENKIAKTGATVKDHHAMVRVESEHKKSEKVEREEGGNTENINIDPPSPPDPSISFSTKKVRTLNSFLESSGLVPQSFDTDIVCTKGMMET
ncbi:hypothetical protein Tco_0945497 [Tanacetum coccineum]